jgi:hypothetical protein
VRLTTQAHTIYCYETLKKIPGPTQDCRAGDDDDDDDDDANDDITETEEMIYVLYSK